MNKNIKVKQLLQLLHENERIRFCETNWNGDTVNLTNIMYIGDKDLYSTYNERHIHRIITDAACLYIFI